MEEFSQPEKKYLRIGDIHTSLLKNKKTVIGVSVFLVVFFIWYFLFSPPRDFPEGGLAEVREGASLRSISLDFKNNNIIRSRVVFESLAILYGGDKSIISGDYSLSKKESVFKIAQRVARGERRLASVRVTIPEGFTVDGIADLFKEKLPKFDKESFLLKAREKEGYLFPDTYFFFSADTEKEVLDSIIRNFENKVGPLREEISKTGKSEKEIIIMASIIEREAKGASDRDVISGILWKRLRIDMPLQVDAAPVTYEKKGLPDSPIANPGILSIKATLNPKDSPYLYYIHDKEGNTHYATNFSQHRANIEKYLK